MASWYKWAAMRWASGEAVPSSRKPYDPLSPQWRTMQSHAVAPFGTGAPRLSAKMKRLFVVTKS
eukprot:14135711-Alexandrium_andersonii.AAC.1